MLMNNRSTKELPYNLFQEKFLNEKAILIDVRSNQEYEEGHLNGAINIPLYQLERKIKNIEKNKQAIILLYCLTGFRSSEGQKILENLGYNNVYSLKGGLNQIWSK